MAFLKSSQITGLSAKDVDVRGFTQAETLKLGDRAYTEHEILLADNYSIIGDVTVSEDLVLSKLSDDGDPITVTGDTTTRTISGSGSISGATMAQTPNASLTGMSGTVGSGVVINSDVTMPPGSILDIIQQTNANRDTSSNSISTHVHTSLYIDVTPKFLTSKFLVELDAYFGRSSHDLTILVDIYDETRSTVITPTGELRATSGDNSKWHRWLNCGPGFPNFAGGDAQYMMDNVNGRILYTPSSGLSTFRLRLRARSNHTNHTWYHNRVSNEIDSRGVRPVSTFTVTEIAT